MRSVADLLRAEERAALATVTPGERVALALALGARDLEGFRLAHEPPLAPAEATRVLEQRRQQSRRPSRCIADADRLSLLGRVAAQLRERRISFAVIGAAAMAVRGVSRSTRDVDLLVVDPECLSPVTWEALRREGIVVSIRRGDAEDPLAGAVRLTGPGQVIHRRPVGVAGPGARARLAE